MKTKLLEILFKIETKEINEFEAKLLLADLIYLNDEELSTRSLTIEPIDYGLWKLKEKGEYLMEGDRIECNKRAIEILNKYS